MIAISALFHSIQPRDYPAEKRRPRRSSRPRWCRARLHRRSLLVPLAVSVLLGCLALTALAEQPGEAANDAVDFNREIRPLLSDHCFQCHGPDPAQREAELRLDTREGTLGEGSKRGVVVPGSKQRSLLYERITSEDPGLRMPPAGAGEPLTERQIARIGRWIEQGAAWEQHWSFVPPRRPPLPPVEQSTWCRTPLDYFILAELESQGLRPEQEADKTTLLRRVTLDLTGLPPTPAELRAFLGDTSPDAYERAVDRLLSSPHYGERMAIPWLDAARFADTSGYQTDGVRDMWRWRDWVIQAMNANLPFDQFTIHQLAGDLLPDPTLDQLIATGFNRNHRANSEGGIVFEEFLVEYAADRVETTATVWLGLTMGCARCHDHKYDPLTQRDFYRMLAYFNNIPERGRVIKYGNAAPFLKTPTPLQAQRLEVARRELDVARQALRQRDEARRAAQRQWEQSAARDPDAQYTIERGLVFHLPLDGDAAINGGRFEPARPYGGEPDYAAGPLDRAAVLAGRSYLDAGQVVEFSGADRFTAAAWVRLDGSHPRSGGESTLLSWMNPEDTRANGVSLDVNNGQLQFQFGPRWLDDAIRVETDRVLQADRWHHVAVVYDGSQRTAGVRFFVDGERQASRGLLDYFTGTMTVNYPMRIGARGEERRWPGAIDEVRFYDRALSSREIAVLATADPIAEIAKVPERQRSVGQRAKIDACFLDSHAPEEIREVARRVEQARLKLRQLREQVPTTMVMRDRAQPTPTHVLMRGQYDRPGERVEPGVPDCLPPLPPGAEPNRLALARWLVTPDHPLTARVAVNRYWQTFFGQGLVKTAEDFGAQGQRPSHPRLLDWLATEFVASGWDAKHLQRLIVTSATYRQASRVTPEKLEKDPENQLLSRAPRLRLPAELVRDQALAIGGLLVPEIGGPSVKPYQPEGLWSEIASDTYSQDSGADLYRRSLYTFWKRTVPPPSMVTFDATSRETCVVRRARTNTPLQALALMNEQTFVEAARGLAQQMLRRPAGSVDERLAWGFERAVARRPTEAEQRILRRGYDRWLARFEAHPEQADKLLAVGPPAVLEPFDPPRLAAYTLAANLMLNLDETIVRE